MVGNDLTELDLRDSEEQVTLRRHGVNQTPHVVVSPAVTAPSQAKDTTAMQASAQAPAPVAVDESLKKIESPMVGTFYLAANPESPQFVTVGSRVEPDTVVCLIEAMKIFNEIKAECSGTVEKILVGNAEAVEFAQGLFLIKPD